MSGVLTVSFSHLIFEVNDSVQFAKHPIIVAALENHARTLVGYLEDWAPRATGQLAAGFYWTTENSTTYHKALQRVNKIELKNFANPARASTKAKRMKTFSINRRLRRSQYDSTVRKKEYFWKALDTLSMKSHVITSRPEHKGTGTLISNVNDYAYYVNYGHIMPDGTTHISGKYFFEAAIELHRTDFAKVMARAANKVLKYYMDEAKKSMKQSKGKK